MMNKIALSIILLVVSLTADIAVSVPSVTL